MAHVTSGFLAKLLSDGHLTPAQLSEARNLHAESREALVRCLSKLGFLSEERLVHLLAQHTGLSVREIRGEDVDLTLLSRLPFHTVRWAGVAPLRREGDEVILAMCDPTNVIALDEVERFLRLHVRPVLCKGSVLERAVREAWLPAHDAVDDTVDKLEREGAPRGSLLEALKSPAAEAEASDEAAAASPELSVERTAPGEEARELLADQATAAPVVRLADLLLSDALERKASDVHIEPQERELVVRFRIDGVLQVIQRLPRSITPHLVSRLKIMSRMNITMRRRPQDGRLWLKPKGSQRRVDVRVSTLPTIYGEKVVMRLLDTSNLNPALSDLLTPAELQTVEPVLAAPQGLLLVTGPTGSGKSTTLYSVLQTINDEGRNFMTLEQPVEYRLAGVSQVDVREEDGNSFLGMLKTVMRQDPDVVLVGEIRDTETARAALQAAITGHYVMSTLHTSDAPSACARLVDLGGDPFLLSEALLAILAQRLVRRLCTGCREAYPAGEETTRRGGPSLAGATLYRAGAGDCEVCGNNGYKGRKAALEILPALPDVLSLIQARSPDGPIRLAARRAGVRSMFQTALNHVLAGDTSLEEVIRAVPRDPVDLHHSCTQCGAAADEGQGYCTACGHRRVHHCHCGLALLPRWSFCPACGETAKRSSFS
jgi:type IV pilus assembly protein PilB